MRTRPNDDWKDEVTFRRGFAVALGIIHHGFGETGMARMVMEEANYTLADLEEAGCADYDLEGIREDLKASPKRRKKRSAGTVKGEK